MSCLQNRLNYLFHKARKFEKRETLEGVMNYDDIFAWLEEGLPLL